MKKQKRYEDYKECGHLVTRVRRTLESCRTMDQLKIARRYEMLVRRYILERYGIFVEIIHNPQDQGDLHGTRSFEVGAETVEAIAEAV